MMILEDVMLLWQHFFYIFYTLFLYRYILYYIAAHAIYEIA